MSGRVVFVHGLWIHAAAWQPWQQLFDAAGFDTTAPGWPGDGTTPDATRQDPDGVAGIGIAQITDHFARQLQQYDQPPVVIGHSFGGLVAQQLLAGGLARAAVAISPAPVKGVTALPLAQIRSALPVLARRANRDRAVTLTRRQFRQGFGNAVTRAESDELYARWAVPGPGRPVFELTAAKKDATSPTRVSLDDTDRGPLLVIGAERDHTIPAVVSRQAAALYRPGTATEYRELPGRGHSLVFDAGWREVADLALQWVREHDRTPRP